MDTSTAPVVPPQAASAPVPAVLPSICRLNFPPSLVGEQTLVTVSVELPLFVNVQIVVSPDEIVIPLTLSPLLVPVELGGNRSRCQEAESSDQPAGGVCSITR